MRNAGQVEHDKLSRVQNNEYAFTQNHSFLYKYTFVVHGA